MGLAAQMRLKLVPPRLKVPWTSTVGTLALFTCSCPSVFARPSRLFFVSSVLELKF